MELQAICGIYIKHGKIVFLFQDMKEMEERKGKKRRAFDSDDEQVDDEREDIAYRKKLKIGKTMKKGGKVHKRMKPGKRKF